MATVLSALQHARDLVESRKAAMSPNKETRHINHCLQNIRENNVLEVKNTIETRFRGKSDHGSKFLSLCDGNERHAKEIEAITMEASRLKDITILRYLIEHGTQVNSIVQVPGSLNKKTTPLHIAIDSALPDTVSLLLDNNADVNWKDSAGQSALQLAVSHADCECTRMLLYRGARVEPDQQGTTLLQMAAKFGHLELVRILLEHNPHIFFEGQIGPSPLHIAATEGHVPLIDLFSHYVDVNLCAPCTPAGEEKTALHLAVERGLVETVRFLLDRFKADVNVLDSEKQNALHCALLHKHDHRRMRRKEDFDYIVELLLKKHVKVNQPNVNGERPLHLASKHQYHRVVELLLLVHADPLAKNNEGVMPMDLIADHDIPMRQLFSKYELLGSSFMSNLHAEVNIATSDEKSVPAHGQLRRSPKNWPAPAPPGSGRPGRGREPPSHSILDCVHKCGRSNEEEQSRVKNCDKNIECEVLVNPTCDEKSTFREKNAYSEKGTCTEKAMSDEKNAYGEQIICDEDTFCETNNCAVKRTCSEKNMCAEKVNSNSKGKRSLRTRSTSRDRHVVFHLHVERLTGSRTEGTSGSGRSPSLTPNSLSLSNSPSPAQ